MRKINENKLNTILTLSKYINENTEVNKMIPSEREMAPITGIKRYIIRDVIYLLSFVGFIDVYPQRGAILLKTIDIEFIKNLEGLALK